MITAEVLGQLLRSLPELRDRHAPGSRVYQFLKQAARQEAEKFFSADAPAEPVLVDPFGELDFPYHRMGNLDSINLFDLDELIIFMFYWVNRNRYRRCLDIGANLGLHSIMMSKCGYTVQCFEPDPVHFSIIEKNLRQNSIKSVEPVNKAVASVAGHQEFVRVLGNTMSSHLAGAKANPYGDLERFPVEMSAFQPLMSGVDLIKLDIEGQECDALLSTQAEDWADTDCLVEVQDADNAGAIYQHFRRIGVNMFSQKCNWQRVEVQTDVPAGYKEGTLFISSKVEMPWKEE